MSENIEQLQVSFNKANMNRNNFKFKLSRTLYDHLSYMEYKIRK